MNHLRMRLKYTDKADKDQNVAQKERNCKTNLQTDFVCHMKSQQFHSGRRIVQIKLFSVRKTNLSASD